MAPIPEGSAEKERMMGQIAEIFGTPQLFARYVLDNADYSRHMLRQMQINPAFVEIVADRLQECVNDPDTRDYLVLTELAAAFIREGKQIPLWLRNFAAGAITGKIVAEQFELPKYSNGNATSQTAAEIVAEVAGKPIDAVLHAIRKHQDFAPPILGAINTP